MPEKLLLFAVFVASMLLMAGNHRRKRKKIVFLGDAVANCIARPGGYITQISRLLKEANLEYKYELVYVGTEGNLITDLVSRIDNDILAEGADIAVIFIGINDLLQKITGETSEKDFEAGYENIIKKLNAADIKIILCTSPAIFERMDLLNDRNQLEMYSKIISGLATKYNCGLADLQQAFFDHHLIYNMNDLEHKIATTDKVHLSNKVNQIVAEEIWKVLQQVNQ